MLKAFLLCVILLVFAVPGHTGQSTNNNPGNIINPLYRGPQKKVEIVSGKKEVFEKNKQIFFFDGKTQIQLTNAGSNRYPVLSPDGGRVLFIRKSNKAAMNPVDGGDGFNDQEDGHSDQLWVIDINSLVEKKLVEDVPWPEGRPHDGGDRLVPWINNAQFSVNGKSIYFLVPCWVTSSALYVISSDGGEARFITGSNYLKVIERGEYKGNLILSDHRYFLYGGSYDWCYIFSPEGKELAVLSEDPDEIDWERLYFEEIPDQGQIKE